MIGVGIVLLPSAYFVEKHSKSFVTWALLQYILWVSPFALVWAGIGDLSQVLRRSNHRVQNFSASDRPRIPKSVLKISVERQWTLYAAMIVGMFAITTTLVGIAMHSPIAYGTKNAPDSSTWWVPPTTPLWVFQALILIFVFWWPLSTFLVWLSAPRDESGERYSLAWIWGIGGYPAALIVARIAWDIPPR